MYCYDLIGCIQSTLTKSIHNQIKYNFKQIWNNFIHSNTLFLRNRSRSFMQSLPKFSKSLNIWFLHISLAGLFDSIGAMLLLKRVVCAYSWEKPFVQQEVAQNSLIHSNLLLFATSSRYSSSLSSSRTSCQCPGLASFFSCLLPHGAVCMGESADIR